MPNWPPPAPRKHSGNRPWRTSLLWHTWKSGAVADAVAQLERAVAADPMNPSPATTWLPSTAQPAEAADAARIYRQIVDRNESEVPALMALAELAAERGDAAEARKRYGQVLTVEPDNNAAAGALAALPAPTPESRGGGTAQGGGLLLDHPEHACARIRVIAPAETLAESVELRWGVDLGADQAGVNNTLIAWADLIVVQRFFPMANTSSLIERILAAGKTVIYETDDLLVGVPATNPHSAGRRCRQTIHFRPDRQGRRRHRLDR